MEISVPNMYPLVHWCLQTIRCKNVGSHLRTYISLSMCLRYRSLLFIIFNVIILIISLALENIFLNMCVSQRDCLFIIAGYVTRCTALFGSCISTWLRL